MKSPLLKLIVAPALALTAALAAAAAGNYDREAAERKADWLFMEALAQKAAGADDAHFALMTRALGLTPDKCGREAYEVGSRRMLLARFSRDSLAFADATQLCENYFGKHPSDSYAGAYLARIHTENNNPQRALEIYEILERERPNSSAIAANHAELLIASERFDEAIDIYRRLEKTMGRNTVLTQRISNLQLWKGDTVAALTEIDDLIKAQPRSADALQLGASAAGEFGRRELALDYIARAIALDPANGATVLYAANTYRKLGMDEQFEEVVGQSVANDDLDRDSKVALVRYYLSEKLDTTFTDPQAERALQMLTDRYPDDYEIRMLMMSYLAGNSRWADAAAELEAAIAAEPGDPADFMRLARIYYTDNRADEAVDALRRGIAIHPEFAELYELLSGLHINGKRYDKAVEAIRSGLEITSLTTTERSDLWRDLADVAQLYPEAGKADELYDKALEENPDNDLAMNNYAYYLSENGGDLLRAKELIAKAVIYNPGSSTYYDTYAWVLFRLGDLEGAKRYIDLAITSDRSTTDGDSPLLAEVLLHAGDIYKALGQTDKAIDYWKRVTALTEADPEVVEKANKRLSEMK